MWPAIPAHKQPRNILEHSIQILDWTIHPNIYSAGTIHIEQSALQTIASWIGVTLHQCSRKQWPHDQWTLTQTYLQQSKTNFELKKGTSTHKQEGYFANITQMFELLFVYWQTLLLTANSTVQIVSKQTLYYNTIYLIGFLSSS